jgi:hypothetical protein
MTDDAERLRGLPRELMQDVKRAAYEAKIRAMEAEATAGVSAHQSSLDPSNGETEPGAT